MIHFAAITFDPASIAGWLIAGLVAAWLGSKMTEEPSYGMMVDLILGGVGGLAGGLLYGIFVAEAGFWGGVLFALLVGAAAVVCARFVLARGCQ